MVRDVRSSRKGGAKASAETALGEEIKQYLEMLMERQTEKLLGRMAALERKLLEKDTIIDKLGGQLAVVKQVNVKYKETIENLQVSVDDLQQYERRYAVRIENIPYVKGESEDDLEEKICEVLDIAGVDVRNDTISRFHRSSAPRQNDDGTVVAQAIVKFRHWAPRLQSHLGRNSAFEKGYVIKHDLTKRRYGLLKKARDLIKGRFDVRDKVYAYADVNCNLTLRRGAAVYRFNTEAELDQAMAQL